MGLIVEVRLFRGETGDLIVKMVHDALRQGGWQPREPVEDPASGARWGGYTYDPKVGWPGLDQMVHSRTPPPLEQLILARCIVARACAALDIEESLWDKLIEAKLFLGHAIHRFYGDAGLDRVMASDRES